MCAARPPDLQDLLGILRSWLKSQLSLKQRPTLRFFFNWGALNRHCDLTAKHRKAEAEPPEGAFSVLPAAQATGVNDKYPN